jgi:hypothetical protein
MGDLVLGWKAHTWSGPKRQCARCPRQVRGGYVHCRHPDGNVLCHFCYTEIMQTPTPGSFHPETN